MRIKLRKGKQTRLIALAKKGRTWLGLSDELELSEGYLRTELRKEQRLLSKEIYNRLCKLTNLNFGESIIEELEDNWGKSKGGKISNGKTKKIKIPEESEELAEFYGIMLGDGNVQKLKAYKVGTYMIRIVGDAKLDKDYHLDYVKPLIENLFNIKVRVGKFRPTTMFLEAHSRELVDFLETKGFKSGNKITNQLEIPDWIRKNKKFLKVCLRGLYDTDGGIYKLNNQTTHQIAFTSHNKVLLEDVREGLISLGIFPSKIVNGKRVYVTKRSELQKFLKLIGFANSRHFNKVKMFNLAP